MRARLGSLIAAALLAFAVAGSPPSAVAQESGEKGKGKEEGKRAGPRVEQGTGKRLNEALEQVKADHPAEARAILGKLDMDRLSPYEKSRVEQLFASIDRTEQKYGSARDHLQKALASGGLNDQETSSVRFQIAQLYMAEDRWKEAVDALKQWFATEQNPNSSAYYLLAVAYYQLGDLQAALEPAQKAIDLAGGKPQESWLQLLAALRIKREEYRLAIPILKQLIEAAPDKKNYWIQLSSADVALGDYGAAALPLQIAYAGGLLTQAEEVRRLAQVLVQIKIPYRAAQILSRAVEQKQVPADTSVYQMLGNFWIAAREYDKAISPLGRAAELADTGEPYVRLAEVYVAREKWAEASDALRHGLDKGKLKNSGNAQLLLGIALYNQKKPQDARFRFERARESPTSRAQAEGWLRQLDADLQAQETLAAADSAR